MANDLLDRTATGHVIGATYRSAYWGYTYRVLGRSSSAYWLGTDGVTVECVDPGPSRTARLGEVWTHCTDLGPRDELVCWPMLGEPADAAAEHEAMRAAALEIAVWTLALVVLANATDPDA